jgi:NTE family protein
MSKNRSRRKKIGLALGSGAVRGFAILPIIQRLQKEGIEISAVSGSSIGALVGAYYALHGEVDSFLETYKTFRKKDFLKLTDLNNPKLSLIKGEKLKVFLTDKFFEDKTFADTKIPLVICTTDLIKRESIYHTKGKLVDAIMSSISIPGVFPPYSWNRKLWVDGGVLDPVPVTILFEMNMQRIIAVNLTRFESKVDREEKDLLPMLMQTFYMMMEQLATCDDDPNVFWLSPRFKPDPVSMLAFYNWEEPYAIGKRYIGRHIKELKDWLRD